LSVAALRSATESGRLTSMVGALLLDSTEPVTLVLRVDVTPDVVRSLLAHASVGSVILSRPPQDTSAFPTDRVGWYAADGVGWQIPGRMCRELLFLGYRSDFGFKAALSAWKAGARRFRSFSSRPRPFMTRSLAVEGLQALWRGLHWRLRVASWPRIVGSATCPNARLTHQISRLGVQGRQTHVPGRLVLAVGSLGPGGAERQVTSLLPGLAPAGWTDVTLVHEQPMLPPHDFFLPEARAAGVDIRALTPVFVRELPELLADEAMASAIACLDTNSELVQRILSYLAEFRSLRPAVVHAWLDAVNVAAGLAACVAGVPRIILGCRSLSPIHFALHQDYMAPAYRFLSRQPGVIFLNNSEAGARDYEKWLSLPRGRVKVVRNGFAFPPEPDLHARCDARVALGLPADVPVVGTVMRLSEEKQPLLWADVAACIARRLPAAHFVVVGDGPLRTDMEERIAKAGLIDRVRFAGHVARAIEVLPALDAFLLTSRGEGLPNVLVEAQAQGVPVVTTAVGGAPETLRQGETGFAIDLSAGVDGLASAVCRLIESPAAHEVYARTAKQWARGHFGLEGMVRATIEHYR
jgi:glycosyltransferase involved in cell wall biosynthesis